MKKNLKYIAFITAPFLAMSMLSGCSAQHNAEVKPVKAITHLNKKYSKKKSTPLLVEQKDSDEQSYDDVDSNAGAFSATLRPNSQFKFISPINSDGSIYRFTNPVKSKGVIKVASNFVPAHKASDKMISNIVNDINKALSSPNSNLDSNTKKDIARKTKDNVQASPSASDETKKKAGELVGDSSTDKPNADHKADSKPDVKPDSSVTPSNPSDHSKPAKPVKPVKPNKPVTPPSHKPVKPKPPAKKGHWVEKQEAYTEYVTETVVVTPAQTKTIHITKGYIPKYDITSPDFENPAEFENWFMAKVEAHGDTDNIGTINWQTLSYDKTITIPAVTKQVQKPVTKYKTVKVWVNN